MRFPRFFVAALVFGVSQAWSMQQQPSVTVSYSTVQNVPMSASALALFALLLVVFALTRLRGKMTRFMSLALAFGLVGLASVSEMRTGYANGVSTLLFSAGNPAIGHGTGVWVIRNDLGAAATITDITASVPYHWSAYSNGYTACSVGLLLAPQAQCAIDVLIPTPA
jgi:hypothetical protein